MAFELLPIGLLDRDADTQSRASLDDEAIGRYVEAIEAEKTLPPLVVYGPTEAGTYYIVDGWHRLAAYARLGRELIACDVYEGGEAAARVASMDFNNDHGVPLTRADKRRRVEILLADPEWCDKSSRMIGEKARVTHNTVEKIRGELAGDGQSGNYPTEREGVDGKKVGARKKAKPEPDLEERDTSEEDDEFFEECKEVEEQAKAERKKKNGREADSTQNRRDAKAAFGAWVRSFEKATKEGKVPDEVKASIHAMNEEIATVGREWWG